jgi:hypothetical protein
MSYRGYPHMDSKQASAHQSRGKGEHHKETLSYISRCQHMLPVSPLHKHVSICSFVLVNTSLSPIFNGGYEMILTINP